MISILSSCGGGSNAIDRTFEAAVIMEEGEIIDIAEPTKVKISGNYSSVSFKFHRHIENADVNVKGLKKIADNETLKKYLPMMSNFSETDYDMSVTGKQDSNGWSYVLFVAKSKTSDACYIQFDIFFSEQGGPTSLTKSYMFTDQGS